MTTNLKALSIALGAALATSVVAPVPQAEASASDAVAACQNALQQKQSGYVVASSTTPTAWAPVFEYVDSANLDHFYVSTRENESLLSAYGYDYHGILGQFSQEFDADAVAVASFFDHTLNKHFLSTDCSIPDGSSSHDIEFNHILGTDESAGNGREPVLHYRSSSNDNVYLLPNASTQAGLQLFGYQQVGRLTTGYRVTETIACLGDSNTSFGCTTGWCEDLARIDSRIVVTNYAVAGAGLSDPNRGENSDGHVQLEEASCGLTQQAVFGTFSCEERCPIRSIRDQNRSVEEARTACANDGNPNWAADSVIIALGSNDRSDEPASTNPFQAGYNIYSEMMALRDDALQRGFRVYVATIPYLVPNYVGSPRMSIDECGKATTTQGGPYGGVSCDRSLNSDEEAHNQRFMVVNALLRQNRDLEGSVIDFDSWLECGETDYFDGIHIRAREERRDRAYQVIAPNL